VVSKRGGDYALIHGQRTKFITDSLLTDEVCAAALQDQFNRLTRACRAVLCVVCVCGRAGGRE
jgi:hypothetical protein